jgi:hypothetical protein
LVEDKHSAFDLREWLGWIAAAVLCATAGVRAARYDTPVDVALPLIASVVVFVAWAVGRPALVAAVPLFIAAELFIADERLRLMLFGAVLAATFAAAMDGAPASAGASRFPRAAAITIGAIVLLRWIPLEDVRPVREVALILLSVAIAGLLRSTPAAIAFAVAMAVFTPAIPMRTLIVPIIAMVICALWRVIGLPSPRLPVIGTTVVALLMLFFAWSGIVARSWPILLRAEAVAERRPGAPAVGPGSSFVLDLPPGARSVILSGANVTNLPEGTPVGRIEPGGIVVRIGDISDWAAMRRQDFAMTKNPFPRDPAGVVRGYGYSAWLSGSGRIGVPAVPRITITGDPGLPPNAVLQIDAVEMGR